MAGKLRPTAAAEVQHAQAVPAAPSSASALPHPPIRVPPFSPAWWLVQAYQEHCISQYSNVTNLHIILLVLTVVTLLGYALFVIRWVSACREKTAWADV